MNKFSICKYFFTAVTILGILLLSSCLKEAPQEVQLELPVYDTEGLIGPTGGIIRVMDQSSPLFGCYLAIKEDALERFVKISIRQTVDPDSTQPANGRIFIELSPTGLIFKSPVEIGLVYTTGKTDSLQQFVYSPVNGEWLPVPFRRLDEGKKLVIGETTHFSTYMVSDHTIRDLYFPDLGLESAIRETTGQYDNQPISLGDVYCIDGLDAAKYNITDLTGIKYLRNLTKLDISENKLTSLQPLSQNRLLEIAAINDNQIEDLAPLSALKNLRTITLDHNQISNLAPLSVLSKLENVSLDNNRITNLTPLVNMTNLRNLTLYKNQISNMTPLAGLYRLQGLEIDHNLITAIPSLHLLDSLQSINLSNNPISNPYNLSKARHLQSITIDSCEISYFPNLPAMDSLRSLSVKFNKISTLADLTGMPLVRNLALMGNRLQEIDQLRFLDSLRVLDLDNNQLDCKLKLSPFKKLSILSAVRNNLRSHHFPFESINDLSELPSLTRLEVLYLDKNHLIMLGNLAGMNSLNTITLDSNYSSKQRSKLASIAALGDLNRLKHVSARFNSISNLYCFNEKMSLEYLALDTNQVTDLLPLGKCYGLQYLSLDYNGIENIDLLLGNPGLGYGDLLHLYHNPLSNTAIHEHIPVLQDRGVTVKWQSSAGKAKPDFNNSTQKRAKIDQEINRLRQKYSPQLKIKAAINER